jgi:hypothetical protein
MSAPSCIVCGARDGGTGSHRIGVFYPPDPTHPRGVYGLCAHHVPTRELCEEIERRIRAHPRYLAAMITAGAAC